MIMLEIENLTAQIDDKQILSGLNLTVKPGEVHAIMGPNGAGKSTLSNVISGREGYEVTAGDIIFKGNSILNIDPDDRAGLGIFLAFQYPVEIPGVPTVTFLKTALNAVRHKRGQDPLDMLEFSKLMKRKAKELDISMDMLKRSLNVGFSGGEKKRNDILQMSLLEPSLCILDETDSGLDIDALKIVADGVNLMRSPERSMIVITHYQRLLDYIKPDYVHILSKGKIVKSGDASLALELEKDGYAAYTNS
ncbi:MAG: Fe-S cluster assembly ATP-binding protein [Alphaproteobacteria bacterium]|jgi:Fe-S cluster assembly ATP-binding protein